MIFEKDNIRVNSEDYTFERFLELVGIFDDYFFEWLNNNYKPSEIFNSFCSILSYEDAWERENVVNFYYSEFVAYIFRNADNYGIKIYKGDY